MTTEEIEKARKAIEDIVANTMTGLNSELDELKLEILRDKLHERG